MKIAEHGPNPASLQQLIDSVRGGYSNRQGSSSILQTTLEDGDFLIYRKPDRTDTTSPLQSVLVVMRRSERPRLSS